MSGRVAAVTAGVIVERHRLVLWSVPILWLVGHALFHVWEVANGREHSGALLEDFAGVTLGAPIGLALCFSARTVTRRAEGGAA